MFRPAALNLPQTLRRLSAVVLACSALVLSACGGGDRAEEYRPSKIVSFGDENSAFSSSPAAVPAGGTPKTINGLLYTVNSLGLKSAWYCTTDLVTTNEPCATGPGRLTAGQVTNFKSDYDTTPPSPTPFPNAFPWYAFDTINVGQVSNTVTWTDIGQANYGTFTSSKGPIKAVTQMTYGCANSNIWVQMLAHNFGKGFIADCPLENVGGAVNHARYNHRVANVVADIAAQMSILGDGTLVTVMAGQHDLLDLFSDVKNSVRTEAAAIVELNSRAATLAASIRSIVQTKAKVVLALTPDLSESPFGAGLSSADRALLKRLTQAFNSRLYFTELSGVSGRSLVGVNPDDYFRNSAYNYTQTACKFDAPGDIRRPDGSAVASSSPLVEPEWVKYCTTVNLRSTTTTYMWADETHLSPTGHTLIGVAAATRAADQF